MKIEPIKEVVISLMQDLATKKTRIQRDDPWALLKKALTKSQLRHIKFNYFRKGVLALYVDSSSWLYSLNLQKQNLLNRLNAQSGNVKDIRFRIGEVK